MDHLTLRAAFAALLSSVALTACGGGSSSTSAGTAPTTSGGGSTETVTGVATPNTVSVVTAKNAN
jgi:hypothetical protein